MIENEINLIADKPGMTLLAGEYIQRGQPLFIKDGVVYVQRVEDIINNYKQLDKQYYKEYEPVVSELQIVDCVDGYYKLLKSVGDHFEKELSEAKMAKGFEILPDFGDHIPRWIVEKAIVAALGTGVMIGFVFGALLMFIICMVV